MFNEEPVRYPWVWKKKIIIIPRRCMYTDKIIWPGIAMQGKRMVVSFFDTEVETVWAKRDAWRTYNRKIL